MPSTTLGSPRERKLVLMLVCALHISGAVALSRLDITPAQLIETPITIALIAGPEAASAVSGPTGDSRVTPESHDLASPPTLALPPTPPATEPIAQPSQERFVEAPPPEPKPEPKPDPKPGPTPEPTPEPRPEPKPQPEPAPRPELRPTTEPTLRPSQTSNVVERPTAISSDTRANANPRTAPPGRSPATGGASNPTAPRFDAAYLNNPAPAYPALSRRMREEGRVSLRVLVSPDGRPGRIELAESSGSSRLDAAAQGAVARWQFVPASQGGRTVEAWVVVPVIFKLEGR